MLKKSLFIFLLLIPNTVLAKKDEATYYIDKYYESVYTEDRRNHYFLGNIRLATEKLSGTNTGIYYILGDHLGSASLTADTTGTITETTDYTPYGSLHYQNTITDIGDDYTFTGKESDEENGLQYFGARYYDNTLGKWSSIDPAVMMLHNNGRLKEVTGRELQQLLEDPQILNSYTYARNNPVILVDPNGEFIFTAIIVAWAVTEVALSAYDAYTTYQTLADSNASGAEKAAVSGLFVAGLALPGAGYSTVGKQGIKHGAKALGKQAVKNTDTVSNVVKSMSPEATKKVHRYWSVTDKGSTMKTFERHFGKHGAGRTAEQYVDDGIGFYRNNKQLGRDHYITSLNEYGVKIKNPDLNYYGIYTKQGRAVSHGPIRDKRPFLNY